MTSSTEKVCGLTVIADIEDTPYYEIESEGVRSMLETLSIGMKYEPADKLIVADIASRCNHPNLLLSNEIILPAKCGSDSLGIVYPLAKTPLSDINVNTLTDEQKLALMNDVQNATLYLHQQGVVHLDITPENVLLDSSGHVYLSNYKCARYVEKDAFISVAVISLSETTKRQLFLTERQSLAEAKVSFKTDLVALGHFFVYLKTGRHLIEILPNEGQYEPNAIKANLNFLDEASINYVLPFLIQTDSVKIDSYTEEKIISGAGQSTPTVSTTVEKVHNPVAVQQAERSTASLANARSDVNLLKKIFAEEDTVKAEAMFLSFDLYCRNQGLSSSSNDNLVAACFFLAINLTEGDTVVDVGRISDVLDERLGSGEDLTNDSVSNSMVEIVSACQGALYPRSVFHRARNLAELQAVYDAKTYSPDMSLDHQGNKDIVSKYVTMKSFMGVDAIGKNTEAVERELQGRSPQRSRSSSQVCGILAKVTITDETTGESATIIAGKRISCDDTQYTGRSEAIHPASIEPSRTPVIKRTALASEQVRGATPLATQQALVLDPSAPIMSSSSARYDPISDSYIK